MFIRHLKSVLILPVNVVLVIPAGLLYLFDYPMLLSEDIILLLGGFVFILLGAIWAILTYRTYLQTAEGTAAPWDPSTKLIVKGPYKFVRNPMILGVCLVLFGQSTLFQSSALLLYCVLFFVGNTFYFKYSEEPGLRKRFGSDYEVYQKNVPRWLPRIPKNLTRIG